MIRSECFFWQATTAVLLKLSRVPVSDYIKKLIIWVIQNLLKYTCAKNCHNGWSYDKAVAKI